MSEQLQTVNSIANLTNVVAAMKAMVAAQDRAYGLPGLVCLYGPSGYGKSFAAAYVANKFRAYYVEAKSLWQRKTYLTHILRDMGIDPERTMDLMLDQVCEQLALSGRPLIIDQADYLVDKGHAPMLMDIYEGSRSPILIVGEERLEAKLLRSSRTVHRRVLKWEQASPADADDCRQLAGLYCRDVEVADDMLAYINATVEGCTGRVAVNLDLVREEALTQGWGRVDPATWGKRALYTGKPGRG